MYSAFSSKLCSALSDAVRVRVPEMGLFVLLLISILFLMQKSAKLTTRLEITNDAHAQMPRFLSSLNRMYADLY